MFKLNERGIALSGVFYGILLLFLFIVLGIIMVLGNGRKSLTSAKENAINELNSKEIIIQGVTLDDENTTNGGNYITNSVDREILDLTITLGEKNNDTKTTVLVTFYNSTNVPYKFSTIKYQGFSSNDVSKYPKLENFTFNEEFGIDVLSLNEHYEKIIDPYSYLTIPITFLYEDLSATTNTFNSYVMFKFVK